MRQNAFLVASVTFLLAVSLPLGGTIAANASKIERTVEATPFSSPDLVTIFHEDFNDNYIDQDIWTIEGVPEDAGEWVQETNGRLEFDAVSTPENRRVKVRSVERYRGEVFEVDFLNGYYYNYLYKRFTVRGEHEGKEYEALINFHDHGQIRFHISIREGSVTLTSENLALWGGYAPTSWNWLFHLKLTINTDGTITASVTDEHGHDLEQTSSIVFPRDLAFQTELAVTLWKKGSPTLVWYDDVRVSARRRIVALDIKPGSLVNSINLESKGVIPVAILATDDFDPIHPVTGVDPASVTFAGAAKAHPRSPMGHWEDVDGDGSIDLLLHFNTQETGIACGDTGAMLTGRTFDERSIEGTDTIKTVKCR